VPASTAPKGGEPRTLPAPAKIFQRSERPNQPNTKENVALREILNKVVAKPPTQNANQPVSAPVPPPAPAPVSLDTLKNLPAQAGKILNLPSKDRAASSEDMNKLKNLILEKEKTPTPTTPGPAPASASTPIPQKPKEVPEDVLRKILE